MSFLYFYTEIIDHFFHWLDHGSQLQIFLLEHQNRGVDDILDRTGINIQFLSCFPGKIQFLGMHFLRCFHDIDRMIRNTFKITNTVKQYG